MNRIRFEPCDDSDGGSVEMAEEAWNSRKEKDENTLNRECDKMNNLRKEEIKPLEETRIRITLCLSSTN